MHDEKTSERMMVRLPSALIAEAGDRNRDDNGKRSKSIMRIKFRPGSATCWGCGKKGHLKRDCRQKKNSGSSNFANAATEEDIEDALICSVDSTFEYWILDSRASFYATSQKSCMTKLVAGKFGCVHLADDEPLDILGKGEVLLRTNNGSTLKLHDVRYIPGLKRNLISVGQLDAEGYSITFVGSSWKIMKGVIVVAGGNTTGTLYMT